MHERAIDSLDTLVDYITQYLAQSSILPIKLIPPIVPRPSSGAFSTPYKYDLATHTVTVRRTGLIGDVMALWDMKESCVTASVQSDTDLFNRMQRYDCTEFQMIGDYGHTFMIMISIYS